MDTTAIKSSGLPIGIAPEIMAQMEEAVRIAMSPIRDPEVMRRACEQMDRLREEIFRETDCLTLVSRPSASCGTANELVFDSVRRSNGSSLRSIPLEPCACGMTIEPARHADRTGRFSGGNWSRPHRAERQRRITAEGAADLAKSSLTSSAEPVSAVCSPGDRISSQIGSASTTASTSPSPSAKAANSSPPMTGW